MSEAKIDLEQELRAGRDVTVQLNHPNRSSAISVLSSPKVTSGSVGGLDTRSVASDANLDLLEETERLLARMGDLTNTKGGAEPSTAGGIAQGSSLNVSMETEDSSELNEMLAKASHLSNMMQSISEGMSLGGGSERPVSTRTSSSHVNGNNNHRRDPEENSIREDPKLAIGSPGVWTPPSGTAEWTPTTCTTEDSHLMHKPCSTSKQDPPGSSGSGHQEPHKTQPENNNNVPPSPATLKRPTSSVNLSAMVMDDDVSSVGSQSFRPYSRLEPQPRQPFSPSPLLTHHPEVDSHGQDLFLPPTMDLTATTNTDHPNNNPGTPVCANIPPITMVESSPRQQGAVEWEKVTTATPGEDDYVPLVDYSHVRPTPPASPNQESRVERHRKRTMARRQRRPRILVPLVVVLAAVCGVYYFYCRRTVEPPMQIEEVAAVPTLQTFDTRYGVLARLWPQEGEGYCFEGEDPSLVVALPKFVPPPPKEEVVEEKKPKRRGFFGLLRKD